ncbi:MAG: hypothetical protein AAFX92_06170 [Pseudomonadota bacterium]
MGMLGWSYAQAMDTPMVEIERAIDGRAKFVNQIFGGKQPEPEQMTADQIAAVLDAQVDRQERREARAKHGD